MSNLPTDAIEACIETVESLMDVYGNNSQTDALTIPARAQLAALKAKIVEQQDEIDALDAHISELDKLGDTQ